MADPPAELLHGVLKAVCHEVDVLVGLVVVLLQGRRRRVEGAKLGPGELTRINKRALVQTISVTH